MPKLKTHKGIAKRIKLSGAGKMLHRKSHRNHLLGHKQASTKRTYVKDLEVAKGDADNIKKLMGQYK